MTHEISYTDGRTVAADSYEAAVDRMRDEYPDAEIGHDVASIRAIEEDAR